MSDRPQSVLSPPAVAGSPAARVTIVLAWIFAAALLALSTWLGYWAMFRNDEYQLILLGKTIYEGGRLYLDCWENKPPGMAWINAAAIAVTGGRQWGAWVLPGLWGGASLAVFGIVVTKRWGRAPGCAGVLLAGIVCSVRLYNTPSINPDFYSSTLELAAVSLCMMGAWRFAPTPALAHGAGEGDLPPPRPSRTCGGGRRLLPAFLCISGGLLWAAAVTVKITALASIVTLFGAMVVGWWFGRRDEGTARRTATLPGLLVIVGLMIGLAAVAGVLVANGMAREAWHATFAFNHQYLSGDATRTSSRSVADIYPLMLPLWLAIVGFVAPVQRHLERPTWGLVIGLALWWAVQVVLIPLGPSGSMRYWQATFPPMLCLATLGVWHIAVIWSELGRGGRVGLAALALPAAIVLGLPLYQGWRIGAAQAYTAYCAPDRDRDRLREMGVALRESVPPGGRIYVIGYDPGVYVHSDRLPACRFTYPRGQEQAREILEAIRSGRADVVLASPNPGDWEQFSGADWRAELPAALSRYERSGAIAGYDLWLRRPVVHAATRPAATPLESRPFAP